MSSTTLAGNILVSQEIPTFKLAAVPVIQSTGPAMRQFSSSVASEIAFFADIISFGS